MSISSSFLWRFLEDVWDLLPTRDRKLFEAYWSSKLQIASNLEQKAIEAALSTEVANVPVYLTERWERFLVNDENCDLFTTGDQLILNGTDGAALSRETALYDTVSLSDPSGSIFHEETIKFFDDSVRGLRYGNIVPGTLSISILGTSIDGTGAEITAADELTKAGAFSLAKPGMTLKISNATPADPIGVYTIRAVPDNDTVLIEGSFPVAAATGVDYQINSKLVEYTAGRDYAANLESGNVQALLDGRIPPTEILIVRYRHRSYTRDLDYEVDEIRGTIRRIAGTAIADGATVTASYTYNATATIPMEGSRGAVSGSILTDNGQDFSTLLDNRTLTIKSGPNQGSYPIDAVLTTHQIQISGTFPADQATDVQYSINAYPHGIRVDKSIASIPYLQNTVDDPSVLFVENVDFTVRKGLLSVRSAFPLSMLGPDEVRAHQMWAETVKRDKETPYRNFGVLIDFYRANSEEYKLALQGLWYIFWTGSTPGNVRRGLHILLGLPYARRAGTVTRIDLEAGLIDITDPRGQIITYTIPSGLDPLVELGEEVPRFESLTTGVSVIDKNNEPGFVSNWLGRAGISRFLTDEASLGFGNTDETKALLLLEEHLFLPQILTDAITQRINVGELVTFLDNMKPKWTEYVFSFLVEEEETIFLSEDLPTPELNIDLTTTVGSNQVNQAAVISNFEVQIISELPLFSAETGTAGETIGGGSQATGNFEDLTKDFSALDVKSNDRVRIDSGPHAGYWRVLDRISPTVLALDIPDADLVASGPFTYSLFSSHVLFNVRRTSGRVLGGGSQATGNFRDTGIDFADLGIDRFDTVIIEEGVFKGSWTVLRRISPNILSLDIPDADLVNAIDLDYIIVPVERNLDNDAVNIRGEHTVKVGTDYPAPTTLNTKTDIDLRGATMTNETVKALLLVDIGIGGNEVQAITDADVENNEFDVGVSPGVVTRDHEIASAALTRTDNLGPTVTDAYAI